MPRIRLSNHYNPDDPDDHIDDLHDHFDELEEFRAARAARRPRLVTGPPRVVAEGKSGHRTLDVDAGPTDQRRPGEPGFGGIESPYSSYDVATHGPDAGARLAGDLTVGRDTRLGVHQVRQGGRRRACSTGRCRVDPAACWRSRPSATPTTGCSTGTPATWRAAGCAGPGRPGPWPPNRLRPGTAGRQVGDRGIRCAVARSGRPGARVPYPVQLIGSELMMEFIGEPDGTAAPRLAALDAGNGRVHRALARPGVARWRCWPSRD